MHLLSPEVTLRMSLRHASPAAFFVHPLPKLLHRRTFGRSSPPAPCFSPRSSLIFSFIFPWHYLTYSSLDDASFFSPRAQTLVNSSAAASSNQFGNLYSPSKTALANATIASNFSPFQLFIEPCSYLVPHYHPRADEWEFTYAGTPTGFLVPESYIGDPLNFTLGPGMQAVYPQATLHSQANFGCETVKISVGFHSSDAGFVIPNFWATNFPGFDTTLPPEAAQKIDEAHAALVVSTSLCGSCSRCFCRRRRSSTHTPVADAPLCRTR